MIELVSIFLKWATGNVVRMKWLLIGLAGVSLLGTVWFLTNSYNKLKIKNVRLESQIASYKVQAEAQTKAIEALALEKTKTADRVKKAQFDKATLEGKLKSVQETRDNDLKVFNKDCGRIKTILDKKGTLFVRLANRATERMRKRYESTTSGNSN